MGSKYCVRFWIITTGISKFIYSAAFSDLLGNLSFYLSWKVHQFQARVVGGVCEDRGLVGMPYA